MSFPYKIGFIGTGNLSQAMINGILKSGLVQPTHIFCSNRSVGKLQKVVDTFGVRGLPTNEEVVDAADIIVVAVKPQDFNQAVDPIASLFRNQQIVISVAAGISCQALRRRFPQCRIIRAAPNTPALISQGAIGYLMDKPDQAAESVAEDLFEPLGSVYKVEDEEQLDAVLVASSAGVGFVLELMTYFRDWIEERGIDETMARNIVVDTFLGAAALADFEQDNSLEGLQQKVASKKGITAAGLDSMRELEIERALRYSFEKASLRNQELAKEVN